MSWEEGKPSRNENEWFARRDAEWLREQRLQLDARRADQPTGMRCLRDGTELTERVYGHLRIDVCPTCHGVWLDAGELELLVHLPSATIEQVVREVGSAPGTA
jgi:hypothetical protein